MSTEEQQPGAAAASRLTRDVGPPIPRPPRPTPFLVGFYRSALGKKAVMAVTGIALLGYVLVHMLGNLKLYLGMEDFDHYAEWLRTIGEPALPATAFLWIMRIGLLLAVVFHIHAAYALTRLNRKARPVRYQSHRDYIAANFASRTMRWTGVIVVLFVIFHLMDLTWGNANPDFVRGDTYDNIVHSFQRVPVAIFYIVANLALGLHIFHGAWSMFQSLGLNNPRFNLWRRYFAAGLAAVVTIGNVSFPLMVVTGVVK
ncbi:MAG TPA: succinate dehydrogenase cytochrome b subunit [Acidimicrobiia bacterium]|nr:succinate dehydrogenase cytochrome b subunit [Acidimicrobiia bacterium]